MSADKNIIKWLTASTIISSSLLVAAIVSLIILLPEPTPPPELVFFKHTREIYWPELTDLLRTSLMQSDAQNVPVTLSDNCFLLYSLEDLTEFMEEYRKIKFRPFQAEFNDCDDYADIVHGREREWFTSHTTNSICGSSFGLMRGLLHYIELCNITDGHVMNIFVDTDLQVWGFEPQNGKIYAMPSSQWCNTTDVWTIYV